MEQQIKDLVAKRLPVEIYHTNENGSWLWAIAGVGTNTWLDAYLSEEKAVKFCIKHQLPYTVRGN
ncbi:MAG TPA: hypothetical protein VNU93_03840 [Verrucomicrobiae bacterium]|nr:hypothetical protein [Verrucomicrobiae bacterium]